MKTNLEVIELTQENIESMIYIIRGQKVMLDFDLARIYGYETKRFNEQVKNNIEKFPEDFMFQLNEIESENILWSKKSTLNKSGNKTGMHFKYNPYAFTESGIYMLMTVLKGELAIKQSLALIRLFKQMKDYIADNRPLLDMGELLKIPKKFDKYDREIRNIKHDLKEVMNNFIDPNTYKHFLIMNGEKIEGDLAIKQIYGLAYKSIIIIDNYISLKTLDLLRSKKSDVAITIITDNQAHDRLTQIQLNDFVTQTNIQIDFRECGNEMHDRFIVIDFESGNEKIFLCGALSKDAGNRITTIMLVPFPESYRSLVTKLLNNPHKIINK